MYSITLQCCWWRGQSGIFSSNLTSFKKHIRAYQSIVGAMSIPVWPHHIHHLMAASMNNMQQHKTQMFPNLKITNPSKKCLDPDLDLAMFGSRIFTLEFLVAFCMFYCFVFFKKSYFLVIARLGWGLIAVFSIIPVMEWLKLFVK